MHVHSYFSGLSTTPFARKFCRESYNDPEEVYALLERRGMNLFTLTDHDSIDGAEKLRCRPGFFLSEELTCRMPSGTEVHIGVYDFHERQHAQLQQRRDDLLALLMYLTERRILFSVNHVFSSLTGKREPEDFDWFREYVPAVETRNSHMSEQSNAHAAALAKQWGKIGLGGSDAHAMPSVGTAYTEVPGARDKEEFFAGLHSGMGRVHGESGGFRKLTRDVLVIAREMMREKAWTMALSPLAVLIPAITLYTCLDERLFSRKWAAQVLARQEAWPRRRTAFPQPVLQAAGMAMGEST
ncbi:MAG TPA: PHP domain-containing protein [Candidatus Acidoferrales bacterium]|nr:PHP domain-containing protein [Candidatus Acidoferrales bacterium]